MIFRQLFDTTSSTYTYLLADRDSGEAVLIDPVFEQLRRDTTLLRELGLRLVATLDTHVHADHVTAAWLLRERLGSRIAVAAVAGAAGTDLALRHGERISLGTRWLEVRATPGHTDGCLSYVLDDRSMVFTGDALLIRGCGRTDFQQGSPQRLYRSVHEQLLSLPDDCAIYPGHDYRGLSVSSVAEERRLNPRLGGDASEGDFTGHMLNLALPHPKQMAVAVPANLQCGRPEGERQPPADPDWASLTWAFGGYWEVQPAVLEDLGPLVQVVDVREASEVGEHADALGHIAGSINLPLGELPARVAELDAARPVVTVCRSGARSAQAAVLLQKAGLSRVANLAGGLLRWRGQGHPVVGSGD
ncbi:MBL fold metallo-hydrolase [Sphaerotilus mobilis]|uniref:MBL fold metallo-hydrolase n=1 Tax=Sphaerotilus mobilis TaxID=47994 RepID=UPI00102BAEA9|nr:MBL fold metallo-hydrolase [Sphaerotilus mobilis]